MVKIKEIYSFINSFAPFDTQSDFDNSGLILGDFNNTINSCIVCLDITEKVVAFAISNNVKLIISHHPIIFKPIKNLVLSDPDNKIITELIKHDINVISSHTSFDKCNIGNGAVMAKKLNASSVAKSDIDEFADVFCYDSPIKYEDFIKIFDCQYKDKLARKYKNGSEYIKNGLIIAGSGGRSRDILLQIANNYDIFISSEFSYSNILLAEKLKLNIIDVGHNYAENVFVSTMAEKLQNIIEIIYRISSIEED